MDIPKLLQTLPPQTNKPVDPPDLLSRLQRAGSVAATVLRTETGGVLLSTKFGEISAANNSGLTPGDKIQIRLSDNTQNPTLKFSKLPAPVTTINLPRNSPLTEILHSLQPQVTLVVRQQAQQTMLQIGGNQYSIPRQPALKPGQLATLVYRADQNTVAINPIDTREVLKSTLRQLISQQSAAGSGSLVQLLKFIQTAGKVTQPSQAASAPTTARPVVDATLPATPATAKTLVDLAPALVTLLRSVPASSTLDQQTIKQWVSHITTNRPASDTTGTNPFTLLKKIPLAEKLLSEIILNKSVQSNHRNFSSPVDLKAVADDPAFRQLREAFKLIEQSINQQVHQQVNLRLQQELQQPIAFNLNIPFAEDKSTRALELKIRQQAKGENEDKQAWDIHLSFEFGLLGLISTHIMLDGETISTSFWATKQETKLKIDQSLPDFKQQLQANGFQIGQLQCFEGTLPVNSDIELPKPDSLLDIKV